MLFENIKIEHDVEEYEDRTKTLSGNVDRGNWERLSGLCLEMFIWKIMVGED